MKQETPIIKQDPRELSPEAVDSQPDVIFLVPAEFSNFKRLPYGPLLQQRLTQAEHKLTDAEPYTTVLPNKTGTRLTLAGIAATASPFERLTLARKLIAAHRSPTPKSLAVACFDLPAAVAESACETIVAATAAASFELPSYKTKKSKSKPAPELRIHGHRTAHGYRRSLAAARGNNLARWLTALPPNELTPGNYRKRVEKLAREYGWKATFLDITKLKRLKAGAFLAVAQGSPEPDAGILHLRYAPGKRTGKKALSLVGKGICFDTGGTNLKTARYMHGMHEDMQGSAVALGTLLALTELKVDFPVDCWLALAQNHIGPRAYKQNDIVRAANGKTIEVVHTDAEGRMVLADTLTLASREKPKLIVDYATLTGSCIAALSTRLSGVMTNREALIPKLIEAGAASGERVWPFPLYEDFDKALKSDVADTRQCTLDNDADQILGAMFLKKFLVNDPDWVHVDLAAGNHKGGLAHVPTDVTGFGVRFTLSLVLDQQLMG
jgi:leucyl aminopeptidase